MELNQQIEQYKNDLIQSVQELIRIKSVQGEAQEGKPFGADVDEALNKALSIAEKMGFRTVNLDGYIGYAEYGEGEDYVGVLGHLDVVPEGDGWIYPPYAAEIHDGKIYGRGTMDDKAPILAALYGLKAIKDLQLHLKRKVRVIFGTNEESGCQEMEHYLAREKPPVSGFTPDAEYPIIYAEKGITFFDLVKNLEQKHEEDVVIKSMKGGQRANMVPDYCEAQVVAKDSAQIIKTVQEFAEITGYTIFAEPQDSGVIIKSKGVSAHGSLPHLGKNAIMQMMQLLGKLSLGDNDAANFIAFLNKYVGMETDGKSFGVDLEDKESGKLSFNVGTISLENNEVRLGLNLRYPVTYNLEDMMDLIYKRLEGTGIGVELNLHQKPLYFSVDHPLIKSLQKVYTEQTGMEATLLAIGGGTYAKEMPNIVAFGPILPGEEDLDHQANEYIKIEHLVLNAKIYAHAIHELAK
ncbi:dipeptidase, putative [Desulfosporosinus acidiphilus SJ4]|uniref:Dipeptidase, putative n=1 Tax=Desulfosporosinus acidiphilus (strain DSM 22704 / JCM 16185 / SJ4) TaxID=646529 RepID=I4D5Q4_DESAJ|nr:dipeptidase PepV [Desulfosporosinus acidiphilus]AFM41128.1 dipeptidase, putative [Desulfosporosinus acidiphilus SJ4]